MAATVQKKPGKRRRGQTRKPAKQANNRYLKLAVALVAVGLLAFGAFQVFGNSHNQTTNNSTSLVQAEGGALESLSIDDSHTVASEPVTATDRETRFLGAPSDPDAVSLAEAGQLDHPTLLWFHADWCHICQRVKPEVIDLGEQYDGKVRIVRLNVDHAESRAAARRYGVRATPTFVLFDEEGQVRGHVPGWPGYQSFTNAFDQLLAGS